MASNAVLHWLDGRGWLILAGSMPGTDSIRAHALGVAAADGALAYLATQGANTTADQVLEDLEDLGARSGYLVDVLAEDDNIIFEKLADAGIIVISGDRSASNVRSALLGRVIDGVRTAFEHGAVVLVEGPAAMVFGTWVVRDDGEVDSGLGWLMNGLILPGTASVSEMRETRIVMGAQPSAIAVGVGSESALALGPDGQVETWGDQQVTIALGPSFGA